MENKHLVVSGLIGLGILLVLLFSFGSSKLPAFEDKFNLESNTTLGRESTSPPQITELSGQDLKVGTGSAAVEVGDTITLHYVGAFSNGKVFDSSYERNQPFAVTIGSGQVIAGFDQGVVGMKVGGKRRLLIPPNLAYGQKGQGPIPPNSSLIFEIELLDIKKKEELIPTPSVEVPSPSEMLSATPTVSPSPENP